GDLVHPLAPGPERAAVRLGGAAQCAVEGVRVGVGQAGQGEAAQALRVGRGGGGEGDGGEAVAVGFDEYLAADALAGEPGQVGEPPSLGHPARSSRTRASACTPASQSASSACSAGECETPVGLRTNNMAVGIRAARNPASCPAAVGSTGAVIPAAPSAPVIRSRRFSSKRTSGVYDSGEASNLTPCSAAAAAAAAVIASAVSARVSSSGARASSQARTAEFT